MALEGPKAAIDDILNRTRLRLCEYRDAGGHDDDFLQALVHEFVTEARLHEAGAGAVHMALSVYRMVLQQEQIWELTDAVEMRDSALKTLWQIDDL